MSSHSPVRPRKSQVNSGPLHSMQPRETSPSPNRLRTAKAQSMTLLPSQMYSSTGQTSPHGQQPSPSGGRRSPQLAPGQMQRGLPTPPHPNITALSDELRATSPSPTNGHPHYPRPINHIPPQFLSKFHSMDDNFQMTDELLAEIERADMHAQQAQGLMGHPAYVGTPPKDPSLERVRSIGKSSPKEHEVRRPRDIQTQTPERRNSPTYQSPLGSPGEHTNPAYSTNGRRGTTSETRAAPNQNQNHTPPAAMGARSPDKSLPVQEELDDDVASRQNWRRTPPPPADTRYDNSGRNSRAGHRTEDDDTLIEQSSGSRDDEGSGNTPRSPTTGLPPVSRQHAKTASFGGRGRTGSTDQLGLNGIDPSSVLMDRGHVRHVSDQPPPQYFEQQGRLPKDSQQEAILHAPRASSYGRYYPQMHPDDLRQMHPEDLRQLMEHPTSAYIQYFNSPRPDAPIPPTPHSQTNPPSPSPLLSTRSLEGVAPIGSPYPFPFNHLRRNMSYPPQVPSNYDPNHPSVISEQMARQYQVYAQNNLGHITDSTLSPSTTPFPRGYFNQWANWHTHKILGGGHPPVSSSITSSPSHEPISLPKPPAVGLKKRKSMVNRKPPPRVESTQPRETSPEMLSSSGEETAGEEQRFAVHEEGNWVNGHFEDEGDWVDEDEDEDENDLLELEFHPTFISNIEKRRRRWETRWDALLQAFQALDRQTDATLVLLAAPSHSSKLHMVTSRSIRRRPALARSPMVNHLRIGFRQLAADRRNSRSMNKMSLADRFLTPSSPGAGLEGSPREKDLERALGAALSSLGVLGEINDQREARWREEMRRISEDRERVELLLRQAIGDGNPAIGAPPA